MTRTIRFRAWDKWNKNFYTGHIHSYMLTLKGDLVASIPGDDGELEGWEADKKATERFVLMQYTGLKDKNGKEIYEGDVVTIFGNETNTGVVEYKTQNEEKYPVNGWILNSYGEWLTIWPDCEVIGNIYENPDLIK